MCQFLDEEDDCRYFFTYEYMYDFRVRVQVQQTKGMSNKCKLTTLTLNLFMLDAPISTFSTSVSNRRDVCVVFFIIIMFYTNSCFIQIPVFNANIVDPDQMPHFAPDLGLQCVLMSFLVDDGHKWVKMLIIAAANDILILFCYFFSEKIRLDILCHFSAWQTTHVKYQVLFS